MKFPCATRLIAINAKVSSFSKFERKSYFYPDSPRNFQITQMQYPIIIGGTIIAEVDGITKEFALDRAHMEDDAGMLKHFTAFSGVDYNRAGVPLLEIVSKPVIRSAKEASAYAKAIKLIMEYIDASNCNMEEGSFRIDANISARLKSEKNFRNKVEIKNINSFSFLEMAIDEEIKRQIELYSKNPGLDHNKIIPSRTYRWDSILKQNVLMREKESAEDYRYFPEPDLPPLILSDDYISSLKMKLPEMPQKRLKRYVELGLSKDNADFLVKDKGLSDYFDEGIKYCSDVRSLFSWITVEFAGRFKGEKSISKVISCKNVAKLVTLIGMGIITGKIAKQIADEMVLHPSKDPEQIFTENSKFHPISDSSAIEMIIDEILEKNNKSINDFKNGKEKALDYLIGQIMKYSRGKASPIMTKKLLLQKLGEIK